MIEIPGMPIALKRPRFSSGSVYDSQTRDKKVVRILMQSRRPTIVSCFCTVKITFCFGSREPLQLWNFDRPTRSDLDNLIKFYLDCGNGILWKDDRQITKLECVKKYSKKSCTRIEITPIYTMKKSHEKVFSIMSPEDVTEFKNDFLSICSEWNIDDLIKSSETEEYGSLASTADGLMALSRKWADKIKKINAIKDKDD